MSAPSRWVCFAACFCFLLLPHTADGLGPALLEVGRNELRVSWAAPDNAKDWGQGTLIHVGSLSSSRLIGDLKDRYGFLGIVSLVMYVYETTGPV